MNKSKSKEINDKNIKIHTKRLNSESNSYLNYLKINGQNRLEEIDHA